LTGVRRQPRDLRVEQFVAIGCRVVAAEGEKVGGDRQNKAQKGCQSGETDGFGRHRESIGDQAGDCQHATIRT
jgi:hypothetical protein